MEIPKLLVDDIQSGNVVLFLGAGASYGAFHPKNEPIPLGRDLSAKIARQFLDESYVGGDLAYVAEIAISQKSLYDVQLFIKNIFSEYSPADHHLLIPTFNWKAIYTTNYDLLIEQAYQQKKKEALQLINPVYKNTRQQDIYKPKHVPYYKLHGSFHSIDDEKLPLILTPDQYINHKDGRDMLFEHLKEDAYSYTFLFIGFSFADLDIRSILNKIGSNESKIRSYMVGPKIRDAEASLWEGKKITSIVSPFQEFMNELNAVVPEAFRKIVSEIPKYDHPIISRFAINISEKKPSDNLISFIENDVDYVHRAMSAPDTDPKAFYKGFFENWDPIIRNLDVNRSLKDGILSEVFLNEESETQTTQKLYVLKGHAGSGKSVLLKRIAWEASNSFQCFCIFLKSNSQINFEPIYELYSFVRSRIFLFIDQISKHIYSIEKLIERCQKEKISITILGAERVNTWNTECDLLEKYVENDFQLKYLNEKEIRELIVLLDRYDSLGYLKNKSPEEQITELKEKSDREMLVALHESTHGKPFHEIIENEYNSIRDESAKTLYLTICILHRLGVYVRAGLIARMHNIPFTEFKQRLFKPLDFVVFNHFDYKINDYVYTTRHPQIAEMVFETILKNKQDKYDEYVRILSNLNIDYDSDRTAFIAMTNATSLLNLFDDPMKITNLYELAESRNGQDPKLLQQKAIFEMKRVNGNLNLAEKFLLQAFKDAPNDPIIAHSFAEFEYRKAERAFHKLEKFNYIDSCKAICVNLIRKFPKNSHPYHTLIKAELLRLEYIADNSDGPTIERIVKEIEKHLTEAKQYFPGETFLLELESQFNQLLNRIPEAQEALERAFFINKASPFICLRLANFYESKGDSKKAIEVCRETLKYNLIDKDVNFKLGFLLSHEDQPSYQEIQQAFRRSFTLGDSRYLAHVWYARTCFIMKEFEKAREIFEHTGRANVDPEIKYRPRGIIKSLGSEVFFFGTILRKELNFALIRREDFGDTVYANRIYEENWDELQYYQRVSFKLAFNYKGPIAINIAILD